jgi:hypothetical protein
VSMSGAAAHGVPPSAQLHLGRWRPWRRRAERSLRAPETDRLAQAKRSAGRLRRAYATFERWFDPIDTVWFLLGERRRVRARRLEVDVDFSFDDIVLTGRLLAAIYVLQGVLPSQIVLRHRHRWESVDSLAGAVEGEVEVWPLLAAIDVLWYAVRNIRVRARREAASGATESI